MLAKRIIPCLDVKDGKTVKGVNFKNLKEIGDPVELGKYYSEQGADELVFLDITASHEGRKTFIEIVKKIAETINIPFTVGGGISSVEQVGILLQAGADKVSINSAALKRPNLIKEIADKYGKQCVVVAIDAKLEHDIYYTYINGGRKRTDIKLLDWVKQIQELGAGEILLTSMDTDGVKKGFDLKMLSAVKSIATIPVIASGGAGSMEDFKELFENNYAEAGLAASIFHYNEIGVPTLKNYLKQEKIAIR